MNGSPVCTICEPFGSRCHATFSSRRGSRASRDHCPRHRPQLWCRRSCTKPRAQHRPVADVHDLPCGLGGRSVNVQLKRRRCMDQPRAEHDRGDLAQWRPHERDDCHVELAAGSRQTPGARIRLTLKARTQIPDWGGGATLPVPQAQKRVLVPAEEPAASDAQASQARDEHVGVCRCEGRASAHRSRASSR